jgi:hypothetical protein
VSDGQYQSGTAESYVYDTGAGVFSKINDSSNDGYQPAAPRASHPVFIDTYLFLNRINTGEVYISASEDGSTWDGTYATAESAPDNIVAMAALRGELWLFGELSTEVWANEAAAGFPFSPIPGTTIDYGCSAPRSVAKTTDQLIWLAKTREGQHRVVATQGYAAVPISTPWLEFHLAGYQYFSEAVAWVYFQEGHTFYVLTFPTDNATWVYDVTVGLWHERESSGNRWIAGCFAFAFNKPLVGDIRTGKIYELDLGTYTDDGTAILRKRVTQYFGEDRKEMFYRSLEVEFQPGMGVPVGQGVEPQAMLRWSDDGGRTWGNEHWVSAGAMGQFKTRARWNKLGRARDRVWELTCSDPVPWVVTSATASVTGGRA